MFITRDDVQLYTVAFGNSTRNLLALGGWAGSWELWTNTFTYLSSTWRTIAYDHRGTGATVSPNESINFETLVNDVFVILDALGVEQCVLAAESAGVAVALQAALQQPQRFIGLILVDGRYYWPTLDEKDPFLQGLKNDFQATVGQFVDTCVPEADSASVRRWGRQIIMRSPQAAAVQLYQCMFGVDLRPQLARITQPTLILHGEADHIVPVNASEWLSSQIPDCHLHVFKDTGHVPTVTRPQEVAEAINRYFEHRQ